MGLRPEGLPLDRHGLDPAALEQALGIEPAMAEGHRALGVVCAQLADSECSRRHLELYRQALRLAAGAIATSGGDADG